MAKYLRPIGYRPRRAEYARRDSPASHVWAWVAAVLIIAAGIAIAIYIGRSLFSARTPAPRPAPSKATSARPVPASSPVPNLTTEPAPIRFVFPTLQTHLVEGGPGVFMPTASGEEESAKYGSVRTGSYGGRLLPRFHEGLDIAPTSRDRRGLPLDQVFAAADGTIAYFNRYGGNSSYGIYVVLRHADPVGPVYTLYAHLAALEPGLSVGRAVKAGDPIGRMGHTSTLSIPLVRAHLHFELALMANAGYAGWFRSKKLKPDHGNFNGGNLLSMDPLPAFRAATAGETFCVRDHLQALAPAFTLVVRTARPIPYFNTYPSLWSGAPWHAGAAVLQMSEGGIPLSGRNATEAETTALGKARAAVLSVDEAVLGRNGRRYVVQERGAWRLGQAGDEWLDILLFR